MPVKITHMLIALTVVILMMANPVEFITLVGSIMLFSGFIGGFLFFLGASRLLPNDPALYPETLPAHLAHLAVQRQVASAPTSYHYMNGHYTNGHYANGKK